MRFKKETQNIYIRSMGKILRITALFDNVTQTNHYLERHRDEGVIAEIPPYIFVANLYDKGLAVMRDEGTA